MSTPSAVVFDLGKVLLDFDYGIAIQQIQRQCKLSLPDLHALIDQSPLLLRYESNGLSTAEFFRAIQSASGFCGDLAQFRGMFGDIFTPIEPMIQLHAELQRQGAPTYIFSNTNEIAVAHIRERFPFFGEFDGYVLSYEHSAMKPQDRIYEVVEQLSGRRGAELLYIDDRPENIAAGLRRGWRSILHTSPATTRAAVVQSGLLLS